MVIKETNFFFPSRMKVIYPKNNNNKKNREKKICVSW